ncbi:hypothetical protein FHU10_4332 [Serratia fonticola]|jgi:hypothetical protein|uniref:Uncharacterized protein n=1 Tax=Serratia fonticola TaxID=47917 RepID=A0A542BQD1_SERFO|nr:hypothetical protein FHU09_3372 [Serratia fonticola]TQI97196.1 hypothetical protein FHU11_2673 [Serratia fonticola]TVZ71692.1 hypothetical protein FHU10_4332 [Serratia fonticola]
MKQHKLTTDFCANVALVVICLTALVWGFIDKAA